MVALGNAEACTISEIRFMGDDGGLGRFVQENDPAFHELGVLLLALAPHLDPAFFTRILAEQLPEGGEFPEFGGVKTGNHRGLIPTGETAQFILAGDDLEKRIEVQRMFNTDHWFARRHILWLDGVPEGEPRMSGRIILDPELVERLTTGAVTRPRFSMDFPAEYIDTDLEWDDLVLHPQTLAQVDEIQHWIRHSSTLFDDWGMRRRLKPGYRALFYGPPGTGKTLTATLLAKHTGHDLFRIDLSRVVSKYIGETEKNLSRLFDKAESKRWILFFDEADALFGKRTDIRDAHDKYANQEVAYLLQRIEVYDGLVILATNQRGNIDGAFMRRFQAVVHFPAPDPEKRRALWSRAFPREVQVRDDIDWRSVAARYEMTGAEIMNVAQYCSLEAIADGSCSLDLQRLEFGIIREFMKDGRVV